MKKFMKIVIIFSAILTLSACVTGELAQELEPGMTQNQVTQILGKPDGFQQRGAYTIHKYTNRLISGWSWDRADWLLIYKDGKLVEYGSGEVREKEIGGVHTIFIHQF